MPLQNAHSCVHTNFFYFTKFIYNSVALIKPLKWDLLVKSFCSKSWEHRLDTLWRMSGKVKDSKYSLGGQMTMLRHWGEVSVSRLQSQWMPELGLEPRAMGAITWWSQGDWKLMFTLSTPYDWLLVMCMKHFIARRSCNGTSSAMAAMMLMGGLGSEGLWMN